MYFRCFLQHIWTCKPASKQTSRTMSPNYPEGVSSSLSFLSKDDLFETPPYPIIINSKQSLLNLPGMLNIGTTHSKRREQRTGVI